MLHLPHVPIVVSIVFPRLRAMGWYQIVDIKVEACVLSPWAIERLAGMDPIEDFFVVTACLLMKNSAFLVL